MGKTVIFLPCSLLKVSDDHLTSAGLEHADGRLGAVLPLTHVLKTILRRRVPDVNLTKRSRIYVSYSCSKTSLFG